ncbi:Uncharacterised protein [Capnocytophaga ochracea]|uniref:Uncharacterized protein n=1 Tax=Capnocytophaga ochracea TaxID=1018 RepID=A0A2X2T590_CAPOC|nr:hypothetical protein [Capnocytophaga ochracea]SQA94325.1 Uncharacterised protein [Capnocytophaga ochracea]
MAEKVQNFQVAKKAMKAYTDAYKKLSSNQDKNEAAKTLQNFIVIFNQIDEKHPIDTWKERRFGMLSTSWENLLYSR